MLIIGTKESLVMVLVYGSSNLRNATNFRVLKAKSVIKSATDKREINWRNRVRGIRCYTVKDGVT